MDPGAGAVPGGSRLAVVGDVAVDYYLEVAAGSGDEKATAVRSLRTLGGTGANAAVAAARLGSRVELYSAVGDDPYGPWLREQLTARGVDTSGVRTLPGHSTHATILLRDGSRQVIVDRGVGDRLGDVVPDTLAAATIYVSYAPAAVVALAAAEYGDRTVVGLEAWMVTEHGLREALPAVRLVVTNAAGWQALSQVGAPVGVPVVETRGGDGSVLHEPGGGEVSVAAYPVDVVDPTGAGDCYAGALCHYLDTGVDLVAACRLASAAAALSTRAYGAQAGLPTEAEVRAAARVHPTSNGRPT